MKIYAVVEIEPYELPIYWHYWDSIEKANAGKECAEIATEWSEGCGFHFIIKEIDVL